VLLYIDGTTMIQYSKQQCVYIHQSAIWKLFHVYFMYKSNQRNTILALWKKINIKYFTTDILFYIINNTMLRKRQIRKTQHPTMMLGSVAYRGSFNRRSVVTTAGSFTLIVSKPPSTSRVTSNVPSFFSTLDAKVAWKGREITLL